MKNKHEKGDVIKQGGKLYMCICADKQMAVFAPTKKDIDGDWHTHFKDMFACPISYVSDPLIGFEFITKTNF